jgi:hypothetical protein
MTVTNNATIEWSWGTQFVFAATCDADGTITGDTNGWYDQETALQVTAAPAVYYHFLTWTGTVNSASNPLTLILTEPYLVEAVFAENLTAHGAPEWWLAQYGWTNAFDAAETNDADHDGMLTWQEWVAGTDPTNSSSVLSVTNLFAVDSGFVLHWPGVSNRIYGVDRTTNLIPPTFESIATNLAATPPVNVYTDQAPDTDNVFYRITVGKP